jgi:23S rRNA (guanine2069-N7)-methyltransferase / 23S rRNA (guanine2445-N2)-methyltransferase
VPHSGFSLFVTAPAGTADLAAEEATACGATEVRAQTAGVACQATLEQAYRICLWSRVANRVLLPVAEFQASTPEALYAGVHGVDWQAHLPPGGTLAVDCTSSRSQINHTQFAALKVKDAVVDQFRERTGSRPSVDVAAPSIRLHLHLHRDVATLSLDLSGDSLHRRGYRGAQGPAPLKENLAAAVLLRAGWQKLVAEAGEAVGFVDPMCGSGTFAIEAALIALDVAPGSLRAYFGFLGWRQHDAALWKSLVEEAHERRAAAVPERYVLRGYDRDAQAVRAARENVARAGLQARVQIERCDLDALPAAPTRRGLFAVNPPYGERLGEMSALAPLYALLGKVLRERYLGWQAAVLTGNPPLGKELLVNAKRTHKLYNGPIECRLLRFDVDPAEFVTKRAPGALPVFDATAARARPGAAMFANRLRKNAAALGAWAQAEGVTCYRVYDADMPEYAFSIDIYAAADGGASGGNAAESETRAGRSGPVESAGGGPMPGSAVKWIYVQEYAPPATVDAAKARARREEVFAVVPDALGAEPAAVFVRTRARQRRGTQYDKLAERGAFRAVREGGLKFLVNFTDYLDTGLFLDHRLTRARVRELAADRRFLNLFGYTGAASVYAAAGGARATTTVDMSRPYLDWARRNLELNGFRDSARHRLQQHDVLAWLDAASTERFDLIFLDPPTVSRSKRMARAFEVQRDHVTLIRSALKRLARDGVLVFSNNFRKFKLDAAALADLDVRDVTAATIPRDYARNPKIHHCFEIRLGR